MTLDEMLALLPDNTAGDISAADMRQIVTDLYHAAHSTSNAYAYRWATNGQPPSTGHLTMDQPWQSFATKALISETADDGITPGFAVIDGAVAARVWLTAGASQLIANVTGPSVDLGTYREVPIAIVSITGAQPSNNAAVTLSLVVVAG
jgi:hypothetical protein